MLMSMLKLNRSRSLAFRGSAYEKDSKFDRGLLFAKLKQETMQVKIIDFSILIKSLTRATICQVGKPNKT